MSKNEQAGRVCPLCGRKYTEPPALSRADNATDICPDCGMMEALASVPGRREGPAERTRRAVYATDNRGVRKMGTGIERRVIKMVKAIERAGIKNRLN